MGSHDHDKELSDAEDAEDAESMHSSSTQELGPEGLLRQAEDHREHIIELGGKPTRQIAEYSREVEEKRILLMPRGPSSRRTADEEYYRHYCFMEMCFFNEELMAWQSFMKWFRRKWAQQNDAAGGSLPPPPPVLEIDPLDLQTQYLGFMLLCRKEDEKEQPIVRSWNFKSYERFIEHIAAVERLVAELREKQGPEDDARFQERLGYCAKVLTNWGLGDPAGFQEQLGIVAKELAQMQAQRAHMSQFSGAGPLAGFFQQAADSPEPETQLGETNRKRSHVDKASGPGSAPKSTKAEIQDDIAPAPKRAKCGGSKVEPSQTTTAKPSPKKPRGRASTKRNDEEVEYKHLTSGREPGQKRTGRSPKQAQPAPALDTYMQDKTKSNPKPRGGPRDNPQLLAQEPDVSAKAIGSQSAKKNKRVDKEQKKTKAPSGSGRRRSARIAEKAKNIIW